MSEFIAGEFIQSAFNETMLFVISSRDDSRFVEAVDETGAQQLVDTSLYRRALPGSIYLAIDNSGCQGFFTEKKMFELHDPEKKDPNKMMYVHVNGSENDRYPHFHVYTKFPKTNNERLRTGACISLIENAYFNHGKHQETLTRDQFNALVAVMTYKGAQSPDVKKNGKYRSITWWKYMMMTWNTENPNYEPYDTSDKNMPEYDYDTLTRRKER